MQETSMAQGFLDRTCESDRASCERDDATHGGAEECVAEPVD